MQFTITDTGPNKITMISNNEFIPCFTMGETEGDSSAEITIKDGSCFVGKLQVGEFYFSGQMNAVGKSLTEDKFEVGGSLQGEGLSDTLEIGKKLSMQLGILQWLTWCCLLE